MKAMVLCAGLGTRLRPLTETWPKPAMPFLGQPLFRYTLAALQQSGVTSVGINTHHLPEVMKEVSHRECARLGMQWTHIHEPDIQGTGGGIRGLKSFLSDGPCVVFNGDILFPVNLKSAVDAHVASQAAATMVLLPMPREEKYASVDVDAGGNVCRIAGHGPGAKEFTSWHFAGVHILSPRVFDFMQSFGAEDINRDIYVRMLQAGEKIHAHILRPQGLCWSDMGTPARYLSTHHAVLMGQMSLLALGEGNPFAHLVESSDGFLKVHPSAQLSNVRVAGPAIVAEGARIHPDVWLGSCVSVGAQAQVGKGARLNRVAVLDGASVPENAQWEDCIVGPNMPPIPVVI